MRRCHAAVNDRVRRMPALARGAVLVLAAPVIVGCASADGGDAAGSVVPTDDDAETELVILDPCSKPNLTTVEPGALTFTTGAAPARPYFLTDEPADRAGFESELAYALAAELGFRPQEVTWEIVPAQDVLTGTFLDYDIAIGGYVARPDEYPAIAYSTPYLETTTVLDVNDDNVRRSLLGVAGDGVPAASTLRFAAPVQGVGRPWLIGRGWIPDGGGLALWASGGDEMELARNSTDARLIDEPTAQWLATVRGLEVTDVAGVSPPEVEYSLAMVAGNPLAACVDRALAELSENGALGEITQQWLAPEAWRED